MSDLELLPMPRWDSGDDVAKWIREDLVEWIYLLWSDSEKGVETDGSLFGDLTRIVAAAADFLIDGDVPEARATKPAAIDRLTRRLITILETDPDEDHDEARLLARTIRRSIELLPDSPAATAEVSA